MAQTALGIYNIAVWPGGEEKLITLPGEWYEQLKLKAPHDRVTLHAGNRHTEAKAVFTDEEELLLTDSLRQRLKLPLGRISVKAVDGQLHFGPFLGIYALPSKEPGKPFGELTAVFRDMFTLAAEEGVGLYVFIPGEADWREGSVKAYVYKPDQKHWMQTRRPLPDMVLPKIMGTPADWEAKMRHDYAQMARLVPHGMFSKGTGSKWDVHRTLSGDPATRAYLPDTQVVRRPADIEEMLQKHGSVYIKPSYGTQGRSIYKLDRHPRGGLRLHYTSKGQTRVKRVKRGTLKWQSFLQKTFCSRRTFLVQESLDLVCAQGVQPVDFRWLTQKDGRDRWHVTARVARVGHSGSITTNLHTGGQAMLAEEFLRANGYAEEQERRALLDRLDLAALRISERLEHKAGRIGELGIDFGLTKQGHFYLIEINPRPGRQMLKETAPDVRALSLRRNLEYAKFTTGYEYHA